MAKFLSLLLILIPTYSFAWGDLGHQTVGEIAERNLSIQGKNFIREILGIDALANAATWPDMVRSDPRYALFSDYHFFEIPDGKTSASLSKDKRAPRNADVILTQAPSKMMSRSMSRDAKMVYLRYFVHIVGDVHQPLHIGNGVDRGANLCSVLWKNPETGLVEPSNLHSVIDDGIFSYFKIEFLRKNNSDTSSAKKYFGYRDLTQMILSDEHIKALDPEKIQKTPLANWYDEAIILRNQLYPDPLPVKNPLERRYCKSVNPTTHQVETGNFDPTAIPTLEHPFAERVIPVLKEQLFKAGHRLAFLLNRMAEKYYQGSSDDMDFTQSLILTE